MGETKMPTARERAFVGLRLALPLIEEKCTLELLLSQLALDERPQKASSLLLLLLILADDARWLMVVATSAVTRRSKEIAVKQHKVGVQ